MKTMRVGLAAGWLALALAGWAFAKPTPTATAAPQAASPEETEKKAKELTQKLEKLFKDKKYGEANTVCDQIIKLIPQKPDGYYSKACAQACMKKKKEALDTLETCVKMGFTEADFMDKDPDLSSLHKEAKYAELLEKVKENAKKKAGTVKTVEGSPDDGFPYRLLMSSEATAEKPNRLVVWFQPPTGGMTKEIEQMAPELNKRGFALLMFSPPDFKGWQPEVIQKAVITMGKTSEVKGIDIKKPILFGYGLGGQAALSIYTQNGAKLGGLVLNAAYPILGITQQKQVVLMNPAGELAKLVPFFVLVGEKDDGAFTWKKAEETWVLRGVPLTIHYVPEKAKEWLFDKEQTDALMKWLENPIEATSKPAE